MLKTSEILNTKTLKWSLSIVTIIFVLRAIQLKFSKLELTPLLFVAPRGLITILLFLAIDTKDSILMVNKSLIIISSLIMTFGIMFTNKTGEK